MYSYSFPLLSVSYNRFAAVALNPQPLPPRWTNAGIIIVSGR